MAAAAIAAASAAASSAQLEEASASAAAMPWAHVRGGEKGNSAGGGGEGSCLEVDGLRGELSGGGGEEAIGVAVARSARGGVVGSAGADAAFEERRQSAASRSQSGVSSPSAGGDATLVSAHGVIAVSASRGIEPRGAAGKLLCSLSRNGARFILGDGTGSMPGETWAARPSMLPVFRAWERASSAFCICIVSGERRQSSSDCSTLGVLGAGLAKPEKIDRRRIAPLPVRGREGGIEGAGRATQRHRCRRRHAADCGAGRPRVRGHAPPRPQRPHHRFNLSRFPVRLLPCFTGSATPRSIGSSLIS